MSAPVITNLEKFETAISKYIAEVGGEPPKVMRKQMRLLLDRVGRLTPPKTKAEGRRIVKRDIERAVQPITSKTFQDKSVQKMVRKRDYAGLHEFAQRTSNGLWDIVPFSPRLHQDARNSRGRVPSGKGLLTPDTAELRAYIKQEQEHVGMARGGWAKGLKALGGSAPSWVVDWIQAGKFEDSLGNPIKCFVQSINESPWASRGDDQRLITTALGSRARDILYSIEKALEKAGKDMK